MPIILRLQSLVESQLEGIGPPELISILAELAVIACLFGPLLGTFAVANWLLRRSSGYRAAALHRRPGR
jgi:hypothetical protein